MDISALRFFLVAADKQHFGQAAEELGIAQPALSQRIKALETRLGVRLFERSNRAVHLTDAGKVFAHEARRLVNEADRAVRMTRAADKGTAGELLIGYGGSVIFEPAVCALLQSFKETYPDVSLLMRECSVQEQLDGLSAARLDIALLWGPIGFGHPDLEAHSFRRAGMSVVLRRDHPLAARDTLTLENLRSEAFISLMDPPGVGIGHVVGRLLEAADLSPRIIMRVSSLMSIFGLAGSGLGIGIVPDLPIEIISPAFVQRPLVDAADCNEILIVTAKRRTSNLASNFIDAAASISGAEQDVRDHSKGY
ncbi:LysR family transcriptional regulator [Sphingobium yanoikuyae]|uniref:LysR family transcriptional regulator n=1 Tax=Sphingobium yanoikuyae TaxID=13690 RepID=UPI0022DDED63|nr:LysR substrate-binding domain-containing protein [Sphingobium yanoikuyae]WBQ17609.1 LysR substrate-binding domain-containing protein [Sphingobium yanoikuyae]